MDTAPTFPTSPRPSRLARRTGLAYLGISATGIVAEFAVRGSLVVDDDPVATATNIAESPGLFGVGIGADVVCVAFDLHSLHHGEARIACKIVRRSRPQAVAGQQFMKELGDALDDPSFFGVEVTGPKGEEPFPLKAQRVRLGADHDLQIGKIRLNRIAQSFQRETPRVRDLPEVFLEWIALLKHGQFLRGDVRP